MNLSKHSGNLMIGTGIIHNILGFIMGKDVLADIIRSGFFNSIDQQKDRNAIFWFLFVGFLLMILGKFMQDYLNESSKPLPTSLGYYLLTLTIIGCIIMPVSGIWSMLPQAIIIIAAGQNTSTIEA